VGVVLARTEQAAHRPVEPDGVDVRAVPVVGAAGLGEHRDQAVADRLRPHGVATTVRSGIRPGVDVNGAGGAEPGVHPSYGQPVQTTGEVDDQQIVCMVAEVCSHR